MAREVDGESLPPLPQFVRAQKISIRNDAFANNLGERGLECFAFLAPNGQQNYRATI